ncbi:uncharacterized protein LOC110610832 [Manihot esculenta]|uniref:uncharacterized protein LOC110610832 n=1 Tax=Manihot esculenta TaxID=3983 RepID=UPI001CC37D69|nr:uncharacterized protein LOC110610832 [Manihot esculenta]
MRNRMERNEETSNRFYVVLFRSSQLHRATHQSYKILQAFCFCVLAWNPEEKVKVALDQLPRDASDILDILKAEQAPLKSMASHRGRKGNLANGKCRTSRGTVIEWRV